MKMPRPQRAGFTMIELVTSLAIMSILTFGMASAIMLATRAIPSGQGPTQKVRKTATVLDELAEDLRVAQYITERTANAITFTVPDRDADGVPEVIRYSWSGGAGQPLMRYYNGVPGAQVLEDVHQFDLAYDLTSQVEEYPGPLVEGSEIELSSYTTETPQKANGIDADHWPGQYFEVVLPADAISWSPTRVLIMAGATSPPNGQTQVQLRLPDAADLPSDTVLEQQMMWEPLLEWVHEWEQFQFTTVKGLPPDQGLCLVLAWVSGSGYSARVLGDDGTGFVQTDNAGISWSAKSETLLYYVYGKAVTPGAVKTLTRDHVTAVRIQARAGASPTSLVETAVRTLNLPEALSAVWLADFEADPTKLDLDLDATADWYVRGGGPFAEGQRSNGAWLIDGKLDTNPGNDFGEPTTVEVRLHDTVNDGEAGGIRLRVDRTGDTHAYIQAEIETDGAAGQKLVVSTYDPGLNFVPVVTVAGLPDDYVDVRLLVEPGSDHFNVRVNGRDHGTHDYGRVTFVNEHVIFLYETATNSGIKFDDVRIRVGGTP